MQGLIDSPRDSFTVAQVTALLQAPDLEIEPGLDLLDDTDTTIGDLTPYLQADSGTITRDCNALIHGTCDFTLSTALVWGHDRVRPYVTLSSNLLGLSDCRFNLGIYLVTSPTRKLGDTDIVTGEDAGEYDVTGYDKLYYLTQPVGDSVIMGQGAAVLLQVANLIAAGTGGDPKINIDQTAAASLLASDIVYPLTDSQPATYLDIINDLLAAVNYTPLWVDQDGYFTSTLNVDPTTLTPEWIDTVQDYEANIVTDDREITQDVFSVPNYWVFIANGYPTQPVEGDGQFTFIDNSNSATGYGTRGYYVKTIVSVDAVDQPTLIALAEAQITADQNVPESWSLPCGPLPQSGHFDCVLYIDDDIDGGVTSRKCLVQSWTFAWNGDDMDRLMNTVLVVNN